MKRLPSTTVSAILLFLAALGAALAFTTPASAKEPQPAGLTIVDERPESQDGLFLYSIDHADLDQTSYLFGTIHLPDPRVLEIVDELKPLIKGSDRVFLEIDMMTDQAKLQSMALLPAGERLTDKLPDDLYAEFQAHLSGKGFPPMAFDGFKIWAAASSLSILDYMKSLKLPMDMQIQFEASFNNVETGGLEAPEEQVEIFDAMTQEEQILMLRQVLDELNAGGNPMEEMIAIYLKGDANGLRAYLDKELAEDDYKEISQPLMTRALTERDETLAERIASHLNERPAETQLFAIGAAHLVMDGSVVERLRKKGFEVVQIDELVDKKVPTAIAE